MALREIKTPTQHYWKDDKGIAQGEYKRWDHKTGRLVVHAYYVDGWRHGEYKEWHDNGQLWVHCMYVNGEMEGEHRLYSKAGKLVGHSVMRRGMIMDIDPAGLNDKDKFILTLRYGIQWL